MFRAGIFLLAFAFATAAQAAGDCRPELRLALTAETDREGHLYIPLAVNGRATTMLLCTSCAWSSLGERFVDAAGIKKLQGRLRFVDPAGNEPKYYVSANSVKLGDIAFTGKAEFLVDDDSDVGALGLNLMSNFDLEIDNATKTVSFYRYVECERPALAWAANAVEIPFHTKDGYPKGVMELAGSRLQAAISTGLTHTTMELAIARHRLGIASDTPGVTRIDGVQYGGKVYDRYRYLLAELNMSGLRFTQVPLTLVDLEGHGIHLGTHELKQLRLYFAFKRKKIFAAPLDAR